MDPSNSVALIVAGFVCLVAAITDLWKFKVYNALTIPALFGGLLVSIGFGGFQGLAWSLMGAVLGFSSLVVFFALGGVGAGDVKLLTCLGAWLGPVFTFRVFVASALAAEVYALALVVIADGLLAAMVQMLFLRQRILALGARERSEVMIEVEVRRQDRRRRLVPFAAMTCVGFFATLYWWRGELDQVRLVLGMIGLA